jgi:hypothetical protein
MGFFHEIKPIPATSVWFKFRRALAGVYFGVRRNPFLGLAFQRFKRSFSADIPEPV